jgi:uncharacterized membrane protein (UPF0136 family)
MHPRARTGFSRTRSMPSLIGGFALGSLFAISSIRIRDGLDFAYEAASACLHCRVPPAPPGAAVV